jgi:hypothetical protein
VAQPSCKGSCDASYRISGSANRTLEMVPSCQLKGSGAGSFVAVKSASTWQATPLPKRLVNGLAADATGTVWAVGLLGSGIDLAGNGFPVHTVPLVERYAC